jgi:hypothetical protein
MEMSPFWEAASCSASQEFANMEPEGSLLCSKDPSTGSYPKPDESSPYRSPRAYYMPLPIPSSFSSKR